MFRVINDLGSVPDSQYGAGQHIHIDRRHFTYESVYAVNRFFVAYPNYIKGVGQRNFNEYCENNMGYFDPRTKTFSSEKYSSVNIGRGGTIEFRFFKSTTDLNTFLKNMQFALAITAFTAEDKVKGDHILGTDDKPLKAFNSWVNENKGFYSNLFNFLSSQKLLTLAEIKPPYLLEVPANFQERFFFICNQVKISCPDYPIVPVNTFKRIAYSLISNRTDMGLTSHFNTQITKAFMKKADFFKMPPIPAVRPVEQIAPPARAAARPGTARGGSRLINACR